MNQNPIEQEKNFASSLISALALEETPPTRSEVEDKARKMASIFGYEGDFQSIVNEAMRSVDTRMGAGTSLIDAGAQHDEEWVLKRNDIHWTYSSAYEKFLRSDRWSPSMVQSLSHVGGKILGHLQDPKSEGSWDRRGLVIGHVQSGKTANYMGLIAKAADAGYKFIIVIAGIHNNLRKQTQERIDTGFVGRSSDPQNRTLLGVGLDGEYPHPATLTTINNDFNKTTAAQSGWRLNDFRNPIVIVIKKNVNTLDSLHNWLKDLNANANLEGEAQISDVPMLMIDDEADHASINTNREELDPTRTNSCIRKILNLFTKSCYIGYTATPFANIFINPQAYDDKDREELFPRDFIYCLDAPNTYFGPETVFLDDETSAKHVIPITDCEEYIPLAHKKDYTVPDLPPGLYHAINGFIIARAIRNLRGQHNRHCSMMVNVSRFVNVQQSVRSFINLHTDKLRAAIQANYAMPETHSSQNPCMQALRKAFDEEYSECEFEWSDIKKELLRVFDSFRLYVVNSRSDESLDYKKFEQDGHALTAIAVGGLSLSRGLTIEGLCTSYMYRNTRTYDTLMQMGRWFGYRPDFQDLCRVHLPPDSTNWYAHISDASEELRQQIRKMRIDGLTPKQFGLYVKSHPDNLLITASNKMRSGEKITVRQNFSGRLIETDILPAEDSTNRWNESLIAKFWQSGFGLGIDALQETGKGWTIHNVSVESIREFLEAFKTHPNFMERKSAIIRFLQEISTTHPRGDVLLISIEENDEDEKTHRLGVQYRQKGVEFIGHEGYIRQRSKVSAREDEKLGLTKEQQAEAGNIAHQGGVENPSNVNYREIRQKPLLMLHVLGMSESGEREQAKRVPAFGVSFPFGDYDKEIEIEVVANPVWMQQQLPLDDPDEEDDYDD